MAWKRMGQKKQNQARRRRTTRGAPNSLHLAESLEARLAMVGDTLGAILASPTDNGAEDFDPRVGFISAGQTNQYIVQLTDAVAPIDDDTVAPNAITLLRNGSPLVRGTDYNFAYDSGSDRISLISTTSSFAAGAYSLRIAGNQIRDTAGASISATSFDFVGTTATPTPIAGGFASQQPLGSAIYSSVINVAPESAVFAATSFEEPAIGASTYTPGAGAQEIGWTRATENGTPGPNATYSVQSSAGGLGATAFPPPHGTKAYVSRGHANQVTETLTFQQVDLRNRNGITFSMDVYRSSTGFENGDRLNISLLLSNAQGSTTQTLLNLTNQNVGNSNLLTDDAYRTLTANIDPQWQFAALVIAASTNSQGTDEVLAYDNVQFRSATQTGNSIKYSINLDAGQTISAAIVPAAGFRPQLQIAGPDGMAPVTVDAPAAGAQAVVQTYAAPVAGRYVITIASLDGTSGTSSLQLWLNAAVELEGRGGPSDNELAQAQNIDSAFATVDGNISRAGVVGNRDTTAADYYSFTLGAGETASLGVRGQSSTTYRVDLYDAAGNQITSGVNLTSTGVYVINGFKAPAAGSYYARITGTASTAYAFVVTKNALFSPEDQGNFVPIDLSETGAVLGHLDPFTGFQADYHLVNLIAGQPVRLITTTAAGGPFEYGNNVNPDIDIYDTNFNYMTTMTAGAADGRNVDAVFIPTQSGGHYLRVYSSNFSDAGEYSLRLIGTDPTLPPLVVTNTTPFNGESLASLPGQMTFDFNRPVLLTSVQPSDLIINGVVATGVTIVDGDTVRFTLPPLPEQEEYDIFIEGGSIVDIQGALLTEYTGQFFLDLISPRIISSSISDGDLLAGGGSVSYVVEFSEMMDQVNLSTDDFVLTGASTGQSISAESMSYNFDGTVLTLNFGVLPDDHYSLTLFSQNGAFQDLAGRLLDGEAIFPLPAEGSGDGTAGGNFSLSFDVDFATQAMSALASQNPQGGLIYAGMITGGIYAADTDRITLDLEAGQWISIAVSPNDTLQPHLTIEGPSGNTMAASTGPGADALLQSFIVPATGAYAFRVVGMNSTVGGYQLRAMLNTIFESEAHGGTPNDTLATAQSIDSAMIDVTGSVSRAAVAGSLASTSPGPQIASSVIGFSSQFGTDSWSAEQALGQPNVPTYGDHPNAWAPAPMNGGMHYLTVGFLQPAYTDGMAALESSGNGFIRQIDVLDVDNVYHTVWTGVDTTATGTLGTFIANWPLTNYLVKGIKIYVDTEHNQNEWEEIDAVAMFAPLDAPTDHYSVQLEPGPISIASKSQVGQAGVELLDADGNSLAVGIAAGTNVDSLIDFNISNAGTYYVRVLGQAGTDYNLLVMRNAVLSLEPNDSMDVTQSISMGQAVLGSVSSSGEEEPATPPPPITPSPLAVPVGLPINLIDGDGFLWDIQPDGNISNGTFDAYDGGLVHSGFGFFADGLADDDGREIIIGPSPIDNVQVTRKVYVPSDQGFARFLEIVRNPTGAPVTHTLTLYTNLGSDGGEQVIRSSSGDTTFTTDDLWVITDDADGGPNSSNDPSLLHVIAGAGGAGPISVSGPNGELIYTYQLTLGPGETQIVMHFAAQDNFRAESIAKASELELLKLDALEGMTGEELSQIVNFRTVDTNDFYSIDLEANTTIDLRTFTPGGASNTLHPIVMLFDPDGGLLEVSGGMGENRNAHLRVTAPITGKYTLHVGGLSGTGDYVLQTSIPAQPQVVGRRLFYNNSAWDGSAGASASDDLAIATDKVALLPEGTATFANYSSYSRGINGLMIDVAGLPSTSLSALDFAFKVGNDNDPSGAAWTSAPAPTGLSIRPGAGEGGSDRVTLIWADGAIQKQWLQVTMLATAATGLAAPDVFYFGNAVGDSGQANQAGVANVSAMDEIGARNNPKTLFPASNQASIDFIYDYNRDKQVNPADQLIARNNRTTQANVLKLITVPVASAAAPLRASVLTASALSTSTTPLKASGLLASSASISTVSARIGAASSIDETAAAAAFSSYGAPRREDYSTIDAGADDWLDLLARDRSKRS